MKKLHIFLVVIILIISIIIMIAVIKQKPKTDNASQTSDDTLTENIVESYIPVVEEPNEIEEPAVDTTTSDGHTVDDVEVYTKNELTLSGGESINISHDIILATVYDYYVAYGYDTTANLFINDFNDSYIEIEDFNSGAVFKYNIASNSIEEYEEAE